jgi:hypothetical protein
MEERIIKLEIAFHIGSSSTFFFNFISFLWNK